MKFKELIRNTPQGMALGDKLKILELLLIFIGILIGGIVGYFQWSVNHRLVSLSEVSPDLSYGYDGSKNQFEIVNHGNTSVTVFDSYYSAMGTTTHPTRNVVTIPPRDKMFIPDQQVKSFAGKLIGNKKDGIPKINVTLNVISSQGIIYTSGFIAALDIQDGIIEDIVVNSSFPAIKGDITF